MEPQMPQPLSPAITLGITAVILVKVAARLGHTAGVIEGHAEGLAEGKAVGYAQATIDLEKDQQLSYQRGLFQGLATQVDELLRKFGASLPAIHRQKAV